MKDARCLHGHDEPSRCTQCLGLVPRRVTIADGKTLVDGAPVVAPRSFHQLAYARRTRRRRVRQKVA